MALTITQAANPVVVEDPVLSGRYKTATRTWTLSGTYVTGGHAYSASDLNLTSTGSPVEIDFPDGMFRNGTNAVIPTWDSANQKIMFFQSTTGAPSPLIEVAGGTNLASYAGRVRIRYATSS